MTPAAIIRKIIPERYRPIRYLMDQAWSGTHGIVRSGAFAGMAYGRSSFGSCYIPKVLGIYERECYPAIEWACSQKPSLIVDIGAAEGFYAVGLCRRNPQARVIAFEMEERGRTLLAASARANNCSDRLEIRGACEPPLLREALQTGSGPILVICDCEGYENKLLDPAAAPELKEAMILMESHDVFQPGTADRIKSRFSQSHQIEEIWATPRDPGEYPYRSLYTSLLPKSYLEWAVSEWRPGPMSWLWMRPNALVR